MESEKQPSIIFGLTPKSTLVNAIVLLCISQLFWVLKYVQQVPYGFDFNNPPEGFEFVDNVPWYYDFPITLLGMVLGIAWVKNYFKIENNDNSWKAIKYKFVYVCLATWIIQLIAKIVFFNIVIFFK